MGVNVYTRKKPSTLTAEEKVAIADVLDTTLAPFCLSHSDMGTYDSDPNLPPCTYDNKPKAYRQQLADVRKIAKTCAPGYGTSVDSQTPCQSVTSTQASNGTYSGYG